MRKLIWAVIVALLLTTMPNYASGCSRPARSHHATRKSTVRKGTKTVRVREHKRKGRTKVRAHKRRPPQRRA
jgi:hypothetical protein